MVTYTITQKGGYQALTTFNKEEAEQKLKELQKYGDCWYICKQGIEDEKMPKL